MSLRKEENSEMTQGGFKFIRNSKLRQSVRIKNRLQLPPSALIYMKTLEKNIVKDPVHPTTPHQFLVPYTSLNKSHSMDFSECEELISDDSPLIRRISKRSSKNAIVRKHKSLSTLFNFFH